MDPSKLVTTEMKEAALRTIDDIYTNKTGSLCVSEDYYVLPIIILSVSVLLKTYMEAKSASQLIKIFEMKKEDVVLEHILRGLITPENNVVAVRAIALDNNNGDVLFSYGWKVVGQHRLQRLKGPRMGSKLDGYPWYHPAVSADGRIVFKGDRTHSHLDQKGWWTAPYYSCKSKTWMLSYGVDIFYSDNPDSRGFLGMDIDLRRHEINQCDAGGEPTQVDTFLGTHKCSPDSTTCEFQGGYGWARGAYLCKCRDGFSSERSMERNITILEVARQNERQNQSSLSDDLFRCHKCSEGCTVCRDSSPCLAPYDWAFRITLLTLSVLCIMATVVLAGYVYRNRNSKVIKVANHISLGIILLGCATMYLEMAALFPVHDMYSCIATKWTYHLGFFITYIGLLMMTRRISLLCRNNSTHTVEPLDKQLTQRMLPILFLILIYLGAWTILSPPTAEEIHDRNGLLFKQCTFNWWDYSLVIVEVLFLALGIAVHLNLRNAESLFNKGRLIGYAICNLAAVHALTFCLHHLIFPNAGPDGQYFLGFISTQLSSTVTILFVFGPKVILLIREQGDQHVNQARAEGVTESFSLSAISHTTEVTAAGSHENEELESTYM